MSWGVSVSDFLLSVPTRTKAAMASAGIPIRKNAPSRIKNAASDPILEGCAKPRVLQHSQSNGATLPCPLDGVYRAPAARADAVAQKKGVPSDPLYALPLVPASARRNRPTPG